MSPCLPLTSYVVLPRTVAVIMRCDTGAAAGSSPRQARPDVQSDRGSGGQGPAWRGQWYDGITRLNNVRIMGLKPRLSMGSLGITQTVKLLGFLHFQMLALHRYAPPRPHSAIFSLLVFSSTIK